MCKFSLWRQAAASPHSALDRAGNASQFATGFEPWRRNGDAGPDCTTICTGDLKKMSLCGGIGSSLLSAQSLHAEAGVQSTSQNASSLPQLLLAFCDALDVLNLPGLNQATRQVELLLRTLA